jgi:hypothetical protein
METFASADMKGKIDRSSKDTNKKNSKTTNAFFDRMSKTETYATADMKGKLNKN